MSLISKLFKKKKRYNLPYKFGFIKWSPFALQTGAPVKRIEIIEGDDIQVFPFINNNQVRIIEKNLGVPIFDMTQNEVLPSGEITDIWNPARLDILW